jgi:hypothetical protein
MANAPFKDWELPAPLERVRRKLKSVPDGDRHGVPMRLAIAWGAPLMVEILSAALSDGLPAVEAACSAALGLWRPFGRRDPEHPGSPARARPAGADRHTRGVVPEARFQRDASSMSRSPTAPGTTPRGGQPDDGAHRDPDDDEGPEALRQ